jgi:hypothetical protein
MYTQRRKRSKPAATKRSGANKVGLNKVGANKGGGGIFTRARRTAPSSFRTRAKSAWQTTKQRLFPCCRQLKTAEAEFDRRLKTDKNEAEADCDRKMERFDQVKTIYINDLKTENEKLTMENKILLQENNQLLQFMSKLPDLHSSDASPPRNSTSRRR